MDLSPEEIARYVALDREHKEAQRIADAKERAKEPLKAKIKAYVEAHGGRDRTTTRFGYVLALVPYRKAAVKWKDEFIAITSVERAVELQEAQPMTYSLSVAPEAKAA